MKFFSGRRACLEWRWKFKPSQKRKCFILNYEIDSNWSIDKLMNDSKIRMSRWSFFFTFCQFSFRVTQNKMESLFVSWGIHIRPSNPKIIFPAAFSPVLFIGLFHLISNGGRGNFPISMVTVQSQHSYKSWTIFSPPFYAKNLRVQY